MAGSWPPGVTVTWTFGVSNILAQDLSAAVPPLEAGIMTWPAVCGVEVERVDDNRPVCVLVCFLSDLAEDPTVPPDQSARANWLSGTEAGLTDEPIDGATLPLKLRLNENVIGGWTYEKLLQVVMHEFGHALGFDHSPKRTPSCMEATLDQRVAS